MPEGAIAAGHHENLDILRQSRLEHVVRAHDVGLHGGIERNPPRFGVLALVRVVYRPGLGGKMLHGIELPIQGAQAVLVRADITRNQGQVFLPGKSLPPGEEY